MDIDNQKKYLTEELGKFLVDIDVHISKRFVTINGKQILGYRALAIMLWPNEFLDSNQKIVHHIDGDRTNNSASNLVVLTPKEHKLIHKLFDPNYKEGSRKQSETRIKKGSSKGENNPMFGKRGENNPRYGIRGEKHIFKNNNKHKSTNDYTWKLGPNGKRIYTRREL